MFWDSSAVVPLLTVQPASRFAEALFKRDLEMTVWWGTPVECISALARLERERGIERAGMDAALARLRELGRVWDEVQPTERLRRVALRLLRAHPLRGADALQLAAAVEGSGERPLDLDFACLDRRLAAAASREGFRIVSP